MVPKDNMELAEGFYDDPRNFYLFQLLDISPVILNMVLDNSSGTSRNSPAFEWADIEKIWRSAEARGTPGGYLPRGFPRFRGISTRTF